MILKISVGEQFRENPTGMKYQRNCRWYFIQIRMGFDISDAA